MPEIIPLFFLYILLHYGTNLLVLVFSCYETERKWSSVLIHSHRAPRFRFHPRDYFYRRVYVLLGTYEDGE